MHPFTQSCVDVSPVAVVELCVVRLVRHILALFTAESLLSRSSPALTGGLLLILLAPPIRHPENTHGHTLLDSGLMSLWQTACFHCHGCYCWR